MQKILNLGTSKPSVRSDVTGMGFNDGNAVMSALIDYPQYNRYTIPVGLIGGHKNCPPMYATVLHALGDGWKLLAPPVEYITKINDIEHKEYDWWLVKD